MNPFDVYGMTDRIDPEVLDTIAVRLEARGQNSFFREMLHKYLEAMDIDSARRILDMGCGTGMAARIIAGRAGFHGKIVGIDLSSHLIEAARALCKREGKDRHIEFQAGDSRNLDLPDAGFDAVVAHTLVSHVKEPISMLREAARLVRPGGTVGIFDGDYGSLTFSHEDGDKGKEYDELIQKGIITNTRVMREMPRLLKDAGLQIVASFSHVLADIGKADYWLPALEAYRRLLPNSGAMDAESANHWVDARLRESAEGVFFGASNYYSYVATRPI